MLFMSLYENHKIKMKKHTVKFKRYLLDIDENYIDEKGKKVGKEVTDELMASPVYGIAFAAIKEFNVPKSHAYSDFLIDTQMKLLKNLESAKVKDQPGLNLPVEQLKDAQMRVLKGEKDQLEPEEEKKPKAKAAAAGPKKG